MQKTTRVSSREPRVGTPRFAGRGWVVRVCRLVAAAGLALAVSTAVMAPATEAQAQGMRMRTGMGGPMGGGTPTLSRRSVEAYGRILQLDAEQKEAVQLLADGFRATLSDLEKDVEGKINKLQEDAQDEGWGVFQREMPKIIGEMTEKQQRAEEQFISDVKALLNDEQMGRWPAVERHRRRDLFLRVGMVSGAGVDLWTAHDRIMQRERPEGETPAVAPENAEQVREIIDRYEMDMDRHLVEMERKYREDLRTMSEGTENMFDMQRMQDRLKAYAEIGVRMRNLNRDTVRKLEPLYSAEAASALREEFNSRAYPRIYRASVPSRLYEAALKLGDLTPEQREAVEKAKADYVRAAEPLNEAWARATDAAEETGGGTWGVMMQNMGGMGGEGGGNKELNDARRARRTLDQQAQETLMELLTPEQKKQMPSADSMRENPWEAMMPVEEVEE